MAIMSRVCLNVGSFSRHLRTEAVIRRGLIFISAAHHNFHGKSKPHSFHRHGICCPAVFADNTRSTENMRKINREDMLELTRRNNFHGKSKPHIFHRHGICCQILHKARPSLRHFSTRIPEADRKPGSVWQLLMALKECGLKNDAMMDVLYEEFALFVHVCPCNAVKAIPLQSHSPCQFQHILPIDLAADTMPMEDMRFTFSMEVMMCR